MARISLEKLPYRQFIKPLIYCGIEVDKINEICKRWNLLQINLNDFQDIITELNSEDKIAELIQNNRKLIKAGKAPQMDPKVRDEFKFSEVFDKIVKCISQFTISGDVYDITLPEELTYILFNHRLRPFIECGKGVDFSFYQLNRIWKMFNPVGILHEYYDMYLYYFWNIKSIYPSEILSYIKTAPKDNYYYIHSKILGQGSSCFLGYYGFQDENHYQHILQKMMLKITDFKSVKTYISKELKSLFGFCSKELESNGISEHDPYLPPMQLFHNELTVFDNFQEESAKMIVWRKNQEYYYKNLVYFSQNNREKE